MDINLGINPSLIDIADRLFGILLAAKTLTILGLAVLTFKVLDLFLETNLAIAKKDPLSPDKTKMLTLSTMLIIFTVAPTAIIIRRLWMGDYSVISLSVLAGIAFLGNAIIGNMLKNQLDINDNRRDNTVMITTAFGIIVSIIAGRLGYWIQHLLIGIVNMILDVIRVPFIMYYLLIGTILNLILSFTITKFLGASQMAGEVNVIGSLIGGAAHAIMRRNKIKELKEGLEVQNETTA